MVARVGWNFCQYRMLWGSEGKALLGKVVEGCEEVPSNP